MPAKTSSASTATLVSKTNVAEKSRLRITLMLGRRMNECLIVQSPLMNS